MSSLWPDSFQVSRKRPHISGRCRAGCRGRAGWEFYSKSGRWRRNDRNEKSVGGGEECCIMHVRRRRRMEEERGRDRKKDGTFCNKSARLKTTQTSCCPESCFTSFTCCFSCSCQEILCCYFKCWALQQNFRPVFKDPLFKRAVSKVCNRAADEQAEQSTSFMHMQELQASLFLCSTIGL